MRMGALCVFDQVLWRDLALLVQQELERYARGVSDFLRRRLRALPDFPDRLPDFDPASAPADPVVLFLDWLEHALAAGVSQPHAFSLATSTGGGAVSSRMLILKNIEPAGAASAGEAGSAAGAGSPAGAPDAPAPQPAAWHFASTRSSRKGRELAANPRAAMNFYWPALGRQVRVVGAVSLLSAEESALDWEERPAADGRANPDWQVYALLPAEVEFWQASADRHHIRHRYDL